jgi:hypothetical protein
MNRITLILNHTGWLARYSGPHAADMQDLFGSCTLPTSFTVEADPALVVAEISSRNPGTIVEVR